MSFIFYALIFALLYFISLFGAYHYFQNLYFNESGLKTHLAPERKDVVFLFIPILNTVIACKYILRDWEQDYYKKNRDSQYKIRMKREKSIFKLRKQI